MHWIFIILLVITSLLFIASIINFNKTYTFLYSLSEKKFYIIFILVIVIFTMISYLYYKYKIQPSLNKAYISNKEFIPDDQKDRSKAATLYLFYTTWCPYCKKTWDSTGENQDLPWNKLKKSLGDVENIVNGVEIGITEVDCDVEKRLATDYNIEAYPTIILDYNGKKYSYDAKPTFENLKKFINEVL